MQSLLFVYGTLRRAFDNPAARRLHARSEYLGTATIRARLHHCGTYTGITRGSARLSGEVFRVSPQLLRYLDVYEGPDFRRERVFLRDHPERRAFAWLLRNPPESARSPL